MLSGDLPGALVAKYTSLLQFALDWIAGEDNQVLKERACPRTGKEIKGQISRPGLLYYSI